MSHDFFCKCGHDLFSHGSGKRSRCHFCDCAKCEDKNGEVKEPRTKQDLCPHNAIRRVKENRQTFTAYVCGNCAQIFEVKPHIEPEPGPKEPMFKNPIPWGLRPRQA